MTADMQNTDKVVTLIEECRRMKINIILPDVNTSDFTFTVNDHGHIVYGLGAVKGFGEGPVQSILDARQSGGNFTDLLISSARRSAQSKQARAGSVDRRGAMDSIGPNRARLTASIPEAVQRAEQAARK